MVKIGSKFLKNSTLCKIDLPRSRGCEVGIWSKRSRIIGRSKSSKSTMLTSTQSRFVDFLHLQQLYPFSRICQSTHFTTKMGSFFLLFFTSVLVQCYVLFLKKQQKKMVVRIGKTTTIHEIPPLAHYPLTSSIKGGQNITIY